MSSRLDGDAKKALLDLAAVVDPDAVFAAGVHSAYLARSSAICATINTKILSLTDALKILERIPTNYEHIEEVCVSSQELEQALSLIRNLCNEASCAVGEATLLRMAYTDCDLENKFADTLRAALEVRFSDREKPS
jgi:hypothetical protein